MLQRVTMPGLELPRLYIAEDRKDVQLAKKQGIPFIKWTEGKDALLKQLLRPALEKMFPGIKWNKVLGKRKEFKSKIVHVPGNDEDDPITDCYSNGHVSKDTDETVAIADSKRYFKGSNESAQPMETQYDIADYVGDLSSSVDIDCLMELKLLPTFVGDIVDCIHKNINNNMHWTEGYNKKLGLALGKFNSPRELPNLIILDVSGSIPRGISATMITLIDTLREQCNAELIITASISKYYALGDKLPSPEQIREDFGYGNECDQFYKILKRYVFGREWGHVISFGDNDCPERCWEQNESIDDMDKSATHVHIVHHYHTTRKEQTGYAMWCDSVLCDDSEYNTKWCDICEEW